VPCLPTPAEHCKSGPAWVHKIKHDGYRLIARRTGDRMRLYTRRGYIWTDRYPRIVDALRSLRMRSIVIDGEAVWCGKDGKSDFDKLYSGAHDASVFLYARKCALHAEQRLEGVDCYSRAHKRVLKRISRRVAKTVCQLPYSVVFPARDF
jgi:ATP dependent DNA ligase domain